jgi:RNA polymerase sigma factor (TIGR02999 family)
MKVNNMASPNITQLLHDWSEGKSGAADELLPHVYAELHRQAAAYLRRERPNHTLQATALVHEAYLKLLDQRRVEWQSRNHFYAIAAKVMRRILVDHAKSRNRQKRGGPEDNLQLDEVLIGAATEMDVDIIALDEAMMHLAALDPDQERLVELRYFGGLSLEETADAMGISRATAAREWQMAKAWLHRELTRKVN